MGEATRHGGPAARGSRGLLRWTVLASALLSVIIGGTFAVLLLAVNDLRSAASLASQSRQALAASDRLENLVLDIETGERGFVITGQARFLEPWYDARRVFPAESATFQRLAASVGPGQRQTAHDIVSASRSYIRGYSVPTVAAARQDPETAGSVEVTARGKRLVDDIRAKFDQFTSSGESLLAARQASADADARNASVAAAAGAGGSILLIALSGGFLVRSIVQPVRRASAMAGHVAGGDLSVRMPEDGPWEIGTLERSFNSMAGSLETSRDELRQVAEEQAALRRVATIVARGVSPSDLFSAAAAEMGRILPASGTAVCRFEPDGTVTVVGSWNEDRGPGRSLMIGSRWRVDPGSVAALVLRTGRPSRIAYGAADGGRMGEWALERGIVSAVGCPVEVESSRWGLVTAFFADPGPPPSSTETRMLGFTELLATAMANAQSRAELAASRARVVATADQTRRRIERDLHDGTQQRLISLGLELRAVEADIPPGRDELRARLSHATSGLNDVVTDLQEISRGLHPAILSTGGLGPALRTLVRRSAMPVELSIGEVPRLPESTEVAAYYVVSEALANAVKHAHASGLRVSLTVDTASLRIAVRDDGAGGADPARGSGLTGLRDRVEALGGRLEISSPAGHGTTLVAILPRPQP